MLSLPSGESKTRLRSPDHQPTALTLASWSDRLFGQCLDGIVGALPVLAGFLMLRLFNVGGFLISLGGFWLFFYFLFADGLRGGQSLGKRWIGMYVIDEKSGEPCTFGDSFIRNVFAALGPIDWIFIFGEKHQRLGDKAAGTIVVLD